MFVFLLLNKTQDVIDFIKSTSLKLGNKPISLRNENELKYIAYMLNWLENFNKINNLVLFIENFNEKDLITMLKNNMIITDGKEITIPCTKVIFEKNINLIKNIIADLPENLNWLVLNNQLESINKNQLTQINFNLSITNNTNNGSVFSAEPAGKEGIKEIKELQVLQDFQEEIKELVKEEINELKNELKNKLINQDMKLENISNQLLILLKSLNEVTTLKKIKKKEKKE